MKSARPFLLCLLLSGAAMPAFAQSDEADRVDRLERDIQLLQRQLARGDHSTPSGNGGDEPAGGGTSAAQLEVRLSNIEDQMRKLQGKLEESDFRNKKLSESLDKLQRDVDFRFGELSKSPGAQPADTKPAPAPDSKADAKADAKPEAKTETKTVDKIEPKTEKTIAVATKTDVPDQPTTGGDGVLRAPDDAAKGKDANAELTSPREHYDHAFHLLNQTKYEDAASAFDSFIKKYPKDPLVGNAYYWQGETFYIRRDYVNAADNFRQGFEALPDGPKAADNLLKLAMSLDALNRNKEACVVLQQIVTKFKKSSTNVTAKADQERKRIGCGN